MALSCAGLAAALPDIVLAGLNLVGVLQVGELHKVESDQIAVNFPDPDNLMSSTVEIKVRPQLNARRRHRHRHRPSQTHIRPLAAPRALVLRYRRA